MNIARVLTWTLTIALGGFLFGLDTAVISGAEQDIQDLWELTSFEHGLTVSMALIGTVIGALFGNIPTDRIGRKKTLFWIAVIFLVSAVGSALAADWLTFLIFRFVGGLGVGCSSVTAPLYISELSPASYRGRLVAVFQFNVVLGILVAYMSNYLLQDVGETPWRLMLGVQAIPSTIFLVAILFVPESPRWLISHSHDAEEAAIIFNKINPATASAEVKSILAAKEETTGGTSLFAKRHRASVWLAILIAFFNQASGINAIIYYAPRIFEMAGLGRESALLSTAGIGLVNLIFTMLALTLIDHAGRRKLLFVGSIGMVITLGLVSRAFYLSDFNSYWVPVCLLIFIAFFAVSQGAVIWVFISEIFPNQVRAKGQSLGSFMHWLMAAVVAFSFPYLSEAWGGGASFLFFMIMMVLQLLFVWKVMPETRGKSLESIDTSQWQDRPSGDLSAAVLASGLQSKLNSKQ
ncbi:MAG: sugar porter family MFS transporter [Cyclobacteriaceae bacterium]|nr:sugar porter family MFS transporter [Cyclobacteriaceae bacterium]